MAPDKPQVLAGSSPAVSIQTQRTQRTQRKRLRLDGNRALGYYTHMLVLAVAVSHSPAKQMTSSPAESWFKKRGCPSLTQHVNKQAPSAVRNAVYRVAQKTGPPYLIANIPKIPWPNCVEIGELIIC